MSTIQNSRSISPFTQRFSPARSQKPTPVSGPSTPTAAPSDSDWIGQPRSTPVYSKTVPYIPITNLYTERPNALSRSQSAELSNPMMAAGKPVSRETFNQLLMEIKNQFLLPTGQVRPEFAGPGGLTNVDARIIQLFSTRFLPVHPDDVAALAGGFKSILHSNSPVSKLAAMKGLLTEYRALKYLIKDHPANVAPRQGNLYMDYLGYKKDIPGYMLGNGQAAPLNSQNSRLYPNTTIEFDVPAKKQDVNGHLKPYIYETKCYMIGKAYHSPGQVNQILKYQQAINKGIVSGATVEIKGQFAPELITWARQMIPDVQLVMNLELPSGQEYRIPLTGGKNTIPVTNTFEYTNDDLQVIRGIRNCPDIQHALVDIFHRCPAPHSGPMTLDTYKAFVNQRNQSTWHYFTKPQHPRLS